MADLGQQIVLLTQKQHILGARILLRSAIETLALLIYLNQKTGAVVSGSLSFFEFDEITSKLLLGSKNGATTVAAVNILTALERAEKSYPGLLEMHKDLSESAHPNFDGVLLGYSSSDSEEHETSFRSRWLELFGQQQAPATSYVFLAFEREYDETWPELMTGLERWLRDNDEVLEQQRGRDPAPI